MGRHGGGVADRAPQSTQGTQRVRDTEGTECRGYGNAEGTAGDMQRVGNAEGTGGTRDSEGSRGCEKLSLALYFSWIRMLR